MCILLIILKSSMVLLFVQLVLKFYHLIVIDSINKLKVYHGYLASSYHMGIISGFILNYSHLESIISSGQRVRIFLYFEYSLAVEPANENFTIHLVISLVALVTCLPLLCDQLLVYLCCVINVNVANN